MKASIMDYGVGNLHSISKGLERAGADVEIITSPRELATAECIVFPGVGAFGAAMSVLAPLLPDLRRSIRAGTPVLGVCLGMQILFEASEESPGEGLGVIKGEVRRLRGVRVPQMGWNDVSSREDPLFKGIQRTAKFYFANSYVCQPEDRISIAETDYGGTFPSAVRKGRVCGVQFHPEKCGTDGLTLLGNFIGVAEGRA